MFSVNPVCEDDNAYLLNSSITDNINISGWLWDFGDGSSSIQIGSVYHKYAQSDTAKLIIISDKGCSDSIQKPVTVAKKPVAVISSNAALLFCKGDSVTLSVGKSANYSYKWKLGGTDITGGDSSKFVAKLTGSYTVEVTNNTANCKTTSDPAAVNALNAPAAPLISTDGPTQFCQGDSVTLSVTNTADYTYQWKLNGGAIGSNLNSYIAKASGVYTLTVSNSSGCSSNSSNTITVNVNPKPTVPTVNVSGTTSFCQGGSVDLSVSNNPAYTYQWQNTGTNISGATTDTYVVLSSGVYSLNITNSDGCISKTENVTVNVLTTPAVPLISAGGPLIFCQSDSVELSVTNTAGYTYQWKLNGGAVGLNSSKFTAKNSGTYNLTVSNANNCSVASTNSVDVKVNPAPSAGNISLDGKDTFCEGGSVTLSVPSTTGYTYNWRNEYGLISGATTENYKATTSGTYQLEISNTSGCMARTSQINVTVKPSPDKPVLVSTNYKEGVCPGDNSIRLSANQTVPGYSYQWIKNGVAQLNDTLSYIEFYEQGIYRLRAAIGECTSESDTFNINLPASPEKPTIYVRGPTVWYLACSNTKANEYKWYCNGELIEGAKSYFYVAGSKVGIYQVSISNEQGCFTRSDIYAVPTGYTGTDDIDPFEGLSIYPNPTTGMFTIEINNNIFGELLISVITQQGKEILASRFDKSTEHFYSQINMNGQPKGVYIINLLINKYLVIKKLIVK
jgi:hypothetical protein